jgi:hypothetical protein
MRRVVLGCTTAALLLSSCGEPSADEILADTVSNMAKIESGKLTMRMLTGITNEPQSDVGFELTGPFSIEDGSLVANITYTKVAGPDRATATFISTGERAFIETGSEVREVPPIPFSREIGGASGGLGTLPIGHWFEEPSLSDGGRVGGAETYRLQSRLNVGAALADMFTFARQLGAGSVAGLPNMQPADLEHLERVVRGAEIDIHTGKDDRLLRRLVMDVSFAASGPSELDAVLESLSGVRFTLELSIDEPNLPIDAVTPPTP